MTQNACPFTIAAYLDIVADGLELLSRNKGEPFFYIPVSWELKNYRSGGFDSSIFYDSKNSIIE